MARFISRMLVLALVGLAITGCGDDSGGSADSGPTSEEAFCQAGEQLETDVVALTDLDVVAEGTDAVDQAFSAIRDDTNALLANSQDVAANDLNALERAVDALAVALDDLGGDLTAENGADVLDAVAEVGTEAAALKTTLTETCG